MTKETTYNFYGLSAHGAECQKLPPQLSEERRVSHSRIRTILTSQAQFPPEPEQSEKPKRAKFLNYANSIFTLKY